MRYGLIAAITLLTIAIPGISPPVAAFDFCNDLIEDTKKDLNAALLRDAKPLPKILDGRIREILYRQLQLHSANQERLQAQIGCLKLTGQKPAVLDELGQIIDKHQATLDREYDKLVTPVPNVLDEEL